MLTGRRRRLTIFALGVVTTIALVAIFFWFAWLVNDSPRYAWVGNSLYVAIAILNPLLLIFYLVASRVVPAPSGTALIVMQIAYIATFLGWWWLVATGVDHVLTRRDLRHGAA